MPPPTKLYRANVFFSLYVLGRDESDARRVAARNVERELTRQGTAESIVEVIEVVAQTWIDAEWRESRPYSTPGTQHEGLSCADALREIQANARRADLPGQGKLFGEGQ